ncbi:MAG: hypothetical protein A2511_14400 [Deltaproteobacteria bacterium RIFOXYD12_FULL_50_9]|nr:MAG: hypothetical protein A2511_14400 [Deltaproteobacteria bacterium RIFOXYD12_FULL_50_9]
MFGKKAGHQIVHPANDAVDDKEGETDRTEDQQAGQKVGFDLLSYYIVIWWFCGHSSSIVL